MYISIDDWRLPFGFSIFTVENSRRQRVTSAWNSGPWKSLPRKCPPCASVSAAMSSARSNSPSERVWSTWRMPVVSGAMSDSTTSKRSSSPRSSAGFTSKTSPTSRRRFGSARSIGPRSMPTRCPRGPTFCAAYCSHDPGAQPRSSTRAPGPSRPSLASISSSLKTARAEASLLRLAVGVVLPGPPVRKLGHPRRAARLGATRGGLLGRLERVLGANLDLLALADRLVRRAGGRLLHGDHAAGRPGDRAAHQDREVLVEDLEELEVLDRDALVAHLPAHALALVDAAGCEAAADRAAVAEELVHAVARLGAVHVVALHDALEALALAGRGDVHRDALGEDLRRLERLTDLELGD